MLLELNMVLWALSSVVILYIFAALTAFVAFYGLAFRWWLRPAGVAVFVFTASLLGIIVLVFIGIFLDPRQPWYEAPVDVLWWRPALRFVVYMAIAFATTFLLIVAVRRWSNTNPMQLEVDPRTRPRDRARSKEKMK